MIPTKISLQDFLSYREAEIDLSRGGMIALSGDNGAGKSALAVDALTWTLWGESRARSDDDLVRVGAEECQVTIVVDTSSGRYRIARRRKLPKGSRAGVSALSLELIDDEAAAHNLTGPTIKETQEAIDRLLGLDGRTFINSACLIQGRADEFAQAAPKDRKEVLVEILALGQWQDWAGVAHERYRKSDATVKGLESALDAADVMLAQWDAFHADLVAATALVKDRAAVVASTDARVAEARSLAAAQRDRTTERTTLVAEVERLDELVKTERHQVEQLTTRVNALPDHHAVELLAVRMAQVRKQADALSGLSGQQTQRDRIEAEISRWDAEVKSLTSTVAAGEDIIAQLEAPADDAPIKQCPTCGQDLADEAADRVAAVMEERRQAVEVQSGKLEKFREQKAVAEARLEELRTEETKTPAPAPADLKAAAAATTLLPAVTAEHAAAVAQVEGAGGLMDAIVARKDAADLAVVQAGTTRERLTILTVELEGEGDYEAALAVIETEVRRLTEQVIEATGQRDSLQGRVDQLAEVKSLADANRELAAAARAEMELMAELERALGSNGVQALLIDAAIPQIVEEANVLLALMATGTTIDLRTQRPGKSTGREIETLDLVVADGSGVRPYESYSGGERFRIDFATRIGLSRLLARRAASPCKTLIVDEGFGSQDGRGRMALLEALAMVQDQFQLVLVITHLDDLREYFPSTVQIVKTPNGSTASLV